MTRETMAAGSDRGQQVFATSKFNSELNVFLVSTSYYHRRTLINCPIPDPTQFGVPSIARQHYFASQSPRKFSDAGKAHQLRINECKAAVGDPKVPESSCMLRLSPRKAACDILE